METIRGYILDPSKGLCVSDLTGNVVTAKEFRNSLVKFLEAVGVSNPNADQKAVLNSLFLAIQEDRWTAAHLNEATAWMIRNHRFQRISVADWYDAEVERVYPEMWYKRQVAQGAAPSDYECYEIEGHIVFRLIGGVDLPYTKINYQKLKAQRAQEVVDQLANDYHRSEISTPVGTVMKARSKTSPYEDRNDR